MLPRVCVAKLPQAGAEIPPIGLHPPDIPNYAAKAGQPAQNGHRQIERVNQFRCHAASVPQLNDVLASLGLGPLSDLDSPALLRAFPTDSRWRVVALKRSVG